MSKRTTVRRYKTESVQGEGSYVILSSLKVAEIRRLRSVGDLDAFEEGVKLLAAHVVSWNWVDDEGEPLPLPKGQVSVIDLLTNEESELLSDLMTGIGPDSKNTESKSQ